MHSLTVLGARRGAAALCFVLRSPARSELILWLNRDSAQPDTCPSLQSVPGQLCRKCHRMSDQEAWLTWGDQSPSLCVPVEPLAFPGVQPMSLHNSVTCSVNDYLLTPTVWQALFQGLGIQQWAKHTPNALLEVESDSKNIHWFVTRQMEMGALR